MSGMNDLRRAYGLAPTPAQDGVRVLRGSVQPPAPSRPVPSSPPVRKTGKETFVFRKPRVEPPMTEEEKARLAVDVAAFLKGQS